MSKEAVKQFMGKMSSDEAFAEKVVAGKDKDERLAIAKTAGFDFTSEEFNEIAENGEINIDRTLSYLAKNYESRGIRIFVRSGTGFFRASGWTPVKYKIYTANQHRGAVRFSINNF